MNKKFSTFLVGLLLTSSIGAFAAGVTPVKLGHDVVIRPGETKSADVDATAANSDVMKFEADKLYQLTDADAEKVLVSERNATTGELTLKMVEIATAPINASLWTITKVTDGIHGTAFNFVNKETNFSLAYDVAKAYESAVAIAADDASLNDKEGTIVEGCNVNWAWQTTDDNGTAAFGAKKIYSYSADQKFVYALQADGNGLIHAVKYTKDVAQSFAAAVGAIELKPVLAGSILMTADDLNRMVDFKYLKAENAKAMGIEADNLFSVASTVTPTTESPFLGTKFTAEQVTTIAGYDPDKAGVTADEAKEYVYLKNGSKYLYVSPDFYEANSKFLKLELNDKALSAADENKPTEMSEAAWIARSAFKVTYFPSQDSLVFEPLNALSKNVSTGKWENADYFFNSTNNKYVAFYGTTVNDQTTLQDADNYGQVVIRIGNLTKTESVITAFNTEEFDGSVVPGTLKTRFSYADRTFNYLERVTDLSEGLYFITANGKNIVCNLEGTMQYDVESGDSKKVQDYNNMPATMWVVKSTGCTTVSITNREYASIKKAEGTSTDPVFAGQLYKDATGYYILNTTYKKFADAQLKNEDCMTFASVENAAAKTDEHHGYAYVNPDDLKTKRFYLGYNYFVDQKLYLNVQDNNSFAPSKEDPSMYELEQVMKDGEVVAADVTFGTGVGVNGLKQLKRTAYRLKYIDNDFINNDKKYVYLVSQKGKNPYYKAFTEAEKKVAEAAGATVTEANFYLKSDQINSDAAECYVLIEINNAGTLATSNGYVQAHCEDAVGELSYLNLDNTPEERASAFSLDDKPIALYRTITDAKTAKIFLMRGTAKEYLYEDCGNRVNAPQISDVAGFGYLGLTAEGIHPAEGFTTAMFAQRVKASDDKMPMYLFVVAKDTVADGKWCETDEHGYIAEGEAHSDHTRPFIGYMPGKFLVNLIDSVSAHGDKYKYFGYDRLGFVEGAYRIEGGVEYLYLVQPGHTLAEIKGKDKVISDAKFADDALFKKVTLGEGHSNYTFALRLTDDSDNKDFLIESKGEGSAFGSFKGAWVKVHNGCPVIAKYNSEDSNHEDLTGTMQELISNAQIFNIEDGLDEIATGNDAIQTPSEVSVVAGEGTITVKGAEGKNVVISNILGQKVAATAVTSSEATIAVPAGVVFVSVEGEAAVKAIVK